MDRSDHRDEAARRAAEHLRRGRARTPEEAIERAAAEGPRAHRPTRAQLRAHAQALEESEVGTQGRDQRIAATLREALALLASLEEAVLVGDPDGVDRPPPELHGRSARGEFDFDPVIHARVTTALSPRGIADALAGAGFEDIQCGSVHSRHGVLDRIHGLGAHAAISVIRIPPALRVERDLDLVDGGRVPHASFECVARMLRDAEAKTR